MVMWLRLRPQTDGEPARPPAVGPSSLTNLSLDLIFPPGSPGPRQCNQNLSPGPGCFLTHQFGFPRVRSNINIQTLTLGIIQNSPHSQFPILPMDYYELCLNTVLDHRNLHYHKIEHVLKVI